MRHLIRTLTVISGKSGKGVFHFLLHLISRSGFFIIKNQLVIHFVTNNNRLLIQCGLKDFMRFSAAGIILAAASIKRFDRPFGLLASAEFMNLTQPDT